MWIMATIVQINQRGSLTLPVGVRREFNLQTNDILMVENTPEGILLRPAQAVPLVQFDSTTREGMTRVAEELDELYKGRA